VITAVDTNILLDILVPDAPHGDSSELALYEALGAGAVIVSEAVYAELAAQFPEQVELDRFIQDSGIRLKSSGPQALHAAGRAWGQYLGRRPASLVCPSCGNAQAVTCSRCDALLQPRQHVVADFLVGAHALAQADGLLTRDREYYGTYFPNLRLI
jgi:predicted nucleic acid-binding protein